LKEQKHQQFFTHQYPSWLLRYPKLIHVVYLLNYLLQLRKWYIVQKLNKLLAKKDRPIYLLDAGCGEGQFLFPFANDRKESSFKGIDREKANVAFCNRYVQDQNLTHIVFEQMETEQMNEQNLYDIVLCFSVLPYSKDDRAFLTCLRNAMKTGGELLLYVPINNSTILPFYQWITKRFPNYETIQQNQRVYTEPGLLQLLEDCNLSVIEIKKTYGLFGKLSNELLNTHFILFNASMLPFKVLIGISLLLFYPIILFFMLMDFMLPITSANGCLLLAKRLH
jgi:SAM-dependent methyltransferase